MFVDTVFTSETTGDLATALSAAQGELTEAGKTSFNPGFKSKYADLAEVLQTIRPVAAKHGLSYVQGLGYADGSVQVTTRLMHKSGQFIQCRLDLPITKKDPQGVGSGATYGRRYSLAAIFGIAQDDDDGESQRAAVKKAQPKETGTTTPNQVPATESPIVKALKAKFDAVATEADMKEATGEYAALTPTEQTQVLSAAKAARTRLTGTGTK